MHFLSFVWLNVKSLSYNGFTVAESCSLYNAFDYRAVIEASVFNFVFEVSTIH